MRLGCVVEGDGDLEAVPVLVRRIAEQISLFPHVRKPWQENRSSLLKDGRLEHVVRVAGEQAGPGAGVLIVLDADDDCPAAQGPQWLARAQAGARDIPVGLVLAKREFEGWFLAAAESVAGWRGLLPTSLKSPSDPESIRGAKEWLTKQMPPGRTYSPTLHQTALAAMMDLVLAEQRSASFAKCKREIERLLKELAEGSP